ncbi:MAG: WG repeat-containing protein [Bacteroidales bacterium]|nr:WG repeat-containing protein [Bacteroidales bacterium]
MITNAGVQPPKIPDIPQTSNVPPAIPQKKKSRKKLWIILGSLAGVLLILGGVLFFLLHRGEPDKPDVSLIPVQVDEKWGYINDKGEMVIQPQFAACEYFSCGLARVVDKEGKVGYIDKKGKMVIGAIYKDGTSFNEDLAFVVLENGAPQCINLKGEKVFELPKAERVCVFHEGLAQFCVLDDEGKFLWGYVDKKGNEVIAPAFFANSYFAEGLAVVVEEDGKCGFIDKKGKITIGYQFDSAYGFREGLASVMVEDRWGFIDKKGRMIIPPQFEATSAFYGGMAMVYQNDQMGYVDKKGRLTIAPQYDRASVFAYGEKLAAVGIDDRYGYIDKKGSFVIPLQFDAVSIFVDGIAIVQKDDKFGLIDRKGDYIVHPQYDRIMMPVAIGTWSVESDLYGVDEFVNTFFKNFTSSAVDGLPADATVVDVGCHPRYKDDLSEKLFGFSAYFDEGFPMTRDITLASVKFSFVESASQWNDYTHSYEYNPESHLESVEYNFFLKNRAASRCEDVADAVMSKLESLYHTQRVKHDQGDSPVLYTLEGDDFGFCVMSGNGSLVLVVCFDPFTFSLYLKMLYNSESDVSVEDSVYVDDPLIL